MNSIKDQKNLNKKKVLLRLDLNVPLKKGLITDETRINKIIPILDFLIKEQSKIIIISHVGRPNGKVITDLSLKPICENVEKKINKKIRLVKEDIFKLKKEDLFKDPNDQIVFLENIRFYKEEEKNDTNFAQHLAKLADLYVNDAFSCSHRAHASVSKITEFLPSFAGLQLETEISALKKVTTEIKKDRSLSISFDNNLLTEIQGYEYIFGLGYRIKDLRIRSKLAGPKKVIKSDLNMKADLSVRNNKTIIRYLDLDNNQVSAGQTIWSLKYAADYAFSNNLTAIFYFDYAFSEYAISTAFPQTTIRSGFTLRYNF